MGSPWSASTSASLNVTATAGDLVVVAAFAYDNSLTWNTISDSTAGSNTWNNDWQYDSHGTAHNVSVWASTLAAAITSVTVSVSELNSSGYDGIAALVFTGGATPPLDVVATPLNVSSATTPITTNTTATSTVADAVAVAEIFSSHATPPTNTSSYTDLNPFNGYVQISYKILSVTGAESCSWTFGGSNRTGSCGIAIYGSSALSVSAYEPSVTVIF